MKAAPVFAGAAVGNSVGTAVGKPVSTPDALAAQLIGSDTATAAGVTARCSAPVLALCRALIGAGHDPRTRLEVYRGEVLCLRVCSIGEGAQLEVSGTGFAKTTERAP